MQFAISQTMIIVLLIHTALGCCWHHAHECVSRCCASQAAVAEACHCEAHQHDEHASPRNRLDADTASEGDHDRHEHDCDGIHCAFVRSDRSPEECGERSPDTTPLTWAISARSGSLMPPQFAGAPDSLRSAVAPPVRSHLLLSVQLI